MCLSHLFCSLIEIPRRVMRNKEGVSEEDVEEMIAGKLFRAIHIIVQCVNCVNCTLCICAIYESNFVLKRISCDQEISNNLVSFFIKNITLWKSILPPGSFLQIVILKPLSVGIPRGMFSNMQEGWKAKRIKQIKRKQTQEIVHNPQRNDQNGFNQL